MLRSGHNFHNRHTLALSKMIQCSMDRHRSAGLFLLVSERAFVLAVNLWELVLRLMSEQTRQASALLLTLTLPGEPPVYLSPISSELAYWLQERASLPEPLEQHPADPRQAAHRSAGTVR